MFPLMFFLAWLELHFAVDQKKKKNLTSTRSLLDIFIVFILVVDASSLHTWLCPAK